MTLLVIALIGCLVGIIRLVRAINHLEIWGKEIAFYLE